MATYNVVARLTTPGERDPMRDYTVTETGEPWRNELSGGSRNVGGLLVYDPNGGYIGNFRNWAWFVAFLGQMRALVLRVDGLEIDDDVPEDAAVTGG
jgi:hypothetical protein